MISAVGIEFRIRGKDGEWPPKVVSPQTFLERLPQRACFAEHPVVGNAAGPGMLELRRAGSASGMPDVVLQIEEGGFYLLDNNPTLGDLVLGEAVRYLLGYYGSVSIDEP